MTRPTAILVAVLLVGAGTVGCIGDSPGQPSSISNNESLNQTDVNATPNTTELKEATFNTTLEWSEVRAGARDNVVRGANCIWVMVEPQNIAFHTIQINGTFRSDDLGRGGNAMEVIVDGDSVRGAYYAYWNVVYDPMNLTLDAWPRTEDDLFYMTLELHPPSTREVRLGLSADVALSLTYTGELPEDGKIEFRDANCR